MKSLRYRINQSLEKNQYYFSSSHRVSSCNRRKRKEIGWDPRWSATMCTISRYHGQSFWSSSMEKDSRYSQLDLWKNGLSCARTDASVHQCRWAHLEITKWVKLCLGQFQRNSAITFLLVRKNQNYIPKRVRGGG